MPRHFAVPVLPAACALAFIGWLSLALAAPGGEAIPAGEALPEIGDSPRFTNARFMATHNSYVGDKLGSIRDQLDAGVRFVEFDIHAVGVREVGDYRLGHDSPGHAVACGSGNPDGTKLGDWLRVVADWSDGHAGHAPIVIGIDVKSSKASGESADDATGGGLAARRSFAAGNSGRLNDILIRAFGEKLYRADALSTGRPRLNELRGRVVVVLSGDRPTREQYGWDRGTSPAVAINSAGQVVEVHESGENELRYWTGQYQPDGAIRWHRHGWYATGRRPAVALNDHGWVVAVNQQADAAAVVHRLGRIDADLEVNWGADSEARPFAHGVDPTVRFVDPDGFELRATHRMEGSAQARESTGLLDPTAQSIGWAEAATPAGASRPKADASGGGRKVEVFSGPGGSAPNGILFYRTTGVKTARIRYEQIAFIEHQRGEPAQILNDGAVFCAAANRPEAWPWAAYQRGNGRLVRLWEFNQVPAGAAAAVPATYPATDFPHSDWYREFCRAAGAVQ